MHARKPQALFNILGSASGQTQLANKVGRAEGIPKGTLHRALYVFQVRAEARQYSA